MAIQLQSRSFRRYLNHWSFPAKGWGRGQDCFTWNNPDRESLDQHIVTRSPHPDAGRTETG